jgi:hypothetical protein
MEKLEWTALEYEEKERTRDWFWALGVIVVAGSLASIIYGDYFFAVLLILGGALLGLFAVKPPDMISYELNSKGLKVRNRLYPYENIGAFFVQREIKPMLFIKSERFFMPIISMPIEERDVETIHEIFISQNIPEEEMKEHLSEKIMDVLGF